MNQDFEKFAAAAAPAIFVLLWSTGFVGTKYVIRNADPLTYLAIRMAIVVVLMALICAIARPVWLNRTEIGHSIVAGILVHGFYLGGTAVAISLSIPAGLSALMPGLQPILMATIANRWLGERVTPLQWGGLCHWPCRRRADPARPADQRAGGLGLVCLDRVAGQHHARHAVSTPLLRPDRLAQRQSRAVHRGHRLLHDRRISVRAARGALDRRIRARHDVACRGAVDRLDRPVVLADPASGRDLGGKPVLSGAGGDVGDGLLFCSTNGSMRSRSPAWSPVRPPCSWSTGAPRINHCGSSHRLSARARGPLCDR